MNSLLVKGEIFWKHRAKEHWYKDGDLNTRFYHATTTSRQKANTITLLADLYGEVCILNCGVYMIPKNHFRFISKSYEFTRVGSSCSKFYYLRRR